MDQLVQPAQCQISQARLNEVAAERNLESQNALGANSVLNVWYGKWSGGNKIQTQIRSPFRCQLNAHSGSTKSQRPYICLWFARGACYKGPDCEYLHRSPRESDALKINNTEDCFGRTKFASNRDDMSGIGSFMHPNRTLFVGYFSGQEAKLHQLIRTQFSEWGEIEQIRLAKGGKIAFITYEKLGNAEFAKEAMSNQTITGKETLVVRWSHSIDKAPGLTSEVDEDKLREIVRKTLREKSRKRVNDADEFPGHDCVSSGKRHQASIQL